MDKFIYAVCNSKSNEIKSVMAKNFIDAQNRLIQKYWDKYDDLEEDEWKEFLIELREKHGIVISDNLIEAEEI